MKRLLKPSLLFLPLLWLAGLLLFSAKPAIAQTDATATPGGYPPPATPAQPEEGYPAGRPAHNSSEAEEGYIPPTAPPATNPPTIIGNNDTEVTAVVTPPISRSTLARNRVVLWAGFLVTLFIFGLAVYGAMLMYTRARS
ncbi:hypothetical protein [Candidatus Leptofilum sp.]|uniref:hypothetical protein n=1 Tax=Candidatus Leptofilum sp. TaxID=3241576 RepID=UPI003B594432